MKVGIITFHCAHNYGAMLQCVALQRVIEREGNDVFVIDYEPAYLTRASKVFKPVMQHVRKVYQCYRSRNAAYRAIRVLLGFVRAVASNMFFWKGIKINKEFDGFMKKHMNLTPKTTVAEKLNESVPEIDLIVCGSDQIWNPQITGFGFDPAYFGHFGTPETKRISYAASACNLSDDYFQDFNTLISNMNAVSIRENSTADYLRSKLSLSVRTDLDPTLLLEKSDFKGYEENVSLPKKSFILLYTLEDAESKEKAAKKVFALQKANPDLHIVDISPQRSRRIFNHYRYLGFVSPGAMLKCIDLASVVVTNSFHGTALSIVYQKDFWTAVHSSRGNRIVDLLNMLGLTDRTINDNTISKVDNFGSIDFGSVNVCLNDKRRRSIEYLKKNLENENV